MQSTGMIDLKFYLTYLGTETLLQNSPDGWNDEMVKWERNTKYWGMFRSFTIPLQFVKDGAKILRTAFYTYGLGADVSIRVEKRDRISNLFEQQYTGIVNFASFHDTWESVEVMCEEGGLSNDVQNKEETIFDIPFTPGDRLNILPFQGQISNYETFTQISPEQRDDDEVTDPPTTPTIGLRDFIVKFDDNDFHDFNDGTLHLANYKADPAYTWGIVIDRDCELKMTITPNGRTFSVKQMDTTTMLVPYQFQERLVLNRGGVTTILATWGNGDFYITDYNTWQEFYPSSNGPMTYPASGNFQFQAGDMLTIVAYIYYSDAGTCNYQARFINTSAYVMKTQIFDRLSQINLLAWKPIDLFRAIVKKIGAGYEVKSDFLTARTTLLLPAESCRSALNYTAITRTSLSNFFNSFKATECLGMGVEVINGVDTLVIEPLSYFFNQTTVHSSVNIKNFSLDVADDLMKSEVEIGFAAKTFEDYFGKQEIHGSATFVLPGTGVTSNEKLLSPYRADILGMDQTRLKQLRIDRNDTASIDTKDTDSDNDVFMVDCLFDYSNSTTDFYTVNRDYVIAGVAYPLTVANVRYTPRRCMLRQAQLLSSILHLNTESIMHVSGTKFYNYQTELAPDAAMWENDPITPAEITGSVFLPYYFNFEAPAKFELIENVDTNRYGMISFNYRGATFYGFIMAISAGLAKDKSGTYKLICAPISDLSKLIL